MKGWKHDKFKNQIQYKITKVIEDENGNGQKNRNYVPKNQML